MPRIEPRGLGAYIRKINRRVHGSPAKAAAHAKARGMGWVAILCAWQDKRGQHDRHVEYNRDDIADYAQAFAEEGVDPWVWTFPRATYEHEHARTVREALGHKHVRGVLLDPEVYYKWDSSHEEMDNKTVRGVYEAVEVEGKKGSEDWARYWARTLVRSTLDALGKDQGIGVTSYGVTRFHPNFPWEDFGGVGFGSPQLYRVSDRLVQESVDAWHHLGWDKILPSIPTFGDQSGTNLARHLDKFSGLDISGLIAWSWKQPDHREWGVLQGWAARFNQTNPQPPPPQPGT